MKHFQGWFEKTVIALFTGALFVFLFNYFLGYNSSISWNVTTMADVEEFAVFPFSKGPFSFHFDGEKYALAEVFAAGPIERHYTSDALFLAGILLGVCLLLAAFTTLPRYWFLGSMAVFIVFLINIHLSEINLFGFPAQSSGSVIILLIAYVIPAYLFNAFFHQLHLFWRLLTFMAISAGVVLLSGTSAVTLQEQFISGSYPGLVILTLIFLLVVAEEIVFAILILITRAKGGKNNHIHFLVFSIAYLTIVGLHYAQKAGFKGIGLDFFDPYLLFALSSCIAFWTLKFKTDYFPGLSLPQLRLLFTGMALPAFIFLGFAFYRGNDPVYEGLHYFITYAHLGFGAFFLFYIILNFITPLVNGQQVYRMLFREQNFPYVSAKLGGLAAVTAFFFLARKEPMFLLQAGQYNYLGTREETSGNKPLANEYYLEAIDYGQDNHFASYQLGYHALQQNRIDEAIYRFSRATLRHPSPQCYINLAGVLAMRGDATPALVSLQEGLRIFPDHDYLQNNLGLMYEDQGRKREAAELFAATDFHGKWTNAGLVNLWKVSPQNRSIAKDYQSGNLAVKTNILESLIDSHTPAQLTLDTAGLQGAYPLHRQTYLINACWYFQEASAPARLEQTLNGPMDESLFRAGKNAAALGYYHSGHINQAMYAIDALRPEADNGQKARYSNELGLMALSEHCPGLALTFFEEAVQQGSAPALLNKAACLMELQEYQRAMDWAAYLVSVDSGYAQLLEDLMAIRQRNSLTRDRQLTRLYYYYPEYSIPELAALIAEAPVSYLESLWIKVSKETLKQLQFEKLKAYRKAFATRLDERHFREADLLIALAEGSPAASDHPLARALRMPAEQKVVALRKLADRNALNEPLVLAILQELGKQDKSAAYEVLVTATNVHKTSVPLHKAYILSALELGLTDYAESALDQLGKITGTEDLNSFKAEYAARKQKIQASLW